MHSTVFIAPFAAWALLQSHEVWPATNAASRRSGGPLPVVSMCIADPVVVSADIASPVAWTAVDADIAAPCVEVVIAAAWVPAAPGSWPEPDPRVNSTAAVAPTPPSASAASSVTHAGTCLLKILGRRLEARAAAAGAGACPTRVADGGGACDAAFGSAGRVSPR